MHPNSRVKPARRAQPWSKRRRRTPARALRNDDKNGDGDGDSDGDGDRYRDRDRKHQHLACPFFKAFPTHNTRCLFRNNLTSTSFVVQHLYRCHSVPDPDRVSSSAEDTEDAGQRARRDTDPYGETNSGKPCQYLDQHQLAAVRESPRRGLNQEDRWFAIWKILFPEAPQPESAYVASPEEEILRIARQAIKWEDPFGQYAPVLDRLDWTTVSKTFESNSPGPLPDQGLGGADAAPSLATELGGDGCGPFCPEFSCELNSVIPLSFILPDMLPSYTDLGCEAGEQAFETPPLPTTMDSHDFGFTFSAGPCEKQLSMDSVVPVYQVTN